MPGKPLILNSRALRDILERLQELASNDIAEWTPPSEGDAGTMLQRIFARLMEITLERLNKVPDKNLLEFLNIMGISLLTPSPARAPLTFTLTDGSSATIVPQGTQAVAQPEGEQETVIFETEDDLTVIPAQLVTGFTMDPIWDRYTDQTSELSSQSTDSFTPFVGGKRMPHTIYFGDDALLDFSVATVEIDFGSQPENMQDFLERLKWQYIRNGQSNTITPAVSGISVLTVGLPNMGSPDQTKIRGVSTTADVQKGVQSRWIQASLTTPLPDESLAQTLQISNLELVVKGNGLLPDFAFSNDAILDVTKACYPFGETPKAGDAFYLGSQEVFTKPDANITLNVTVEKPAPPTLVWEYWDPKADAWEPLPSNVVRDGTGSFTADGTISLPQPANMRETEVFGENGYWFRVRIADGAYRGAPEVNSFRLVNNRTELVAADDDLIVLKDPEFVSPESHEALRDVLLIGEDINEGTFVLVVEVVIPEVGDSFLNIAPEIEEQISIGASVERWSIDPLPIATLSVDHIEGDEILRVKLGSGFEPGDIGNVLMIDNNENDANDLEFGIVSSTFDPSAADINLNKPLKSDHSAESNVYSIKPDFFGFAAGQRENFAGAAEGFATETFFPLSDQPGTSDVFYFGKKSEFRYGPEIEVNVAEELPNIRLQWEYLDANGWQPFLDEIDQNGYVRVAVTDGTNSFLRDGTIILLAQPTAAAEVNSQSSHWIRVRISGRHYGRPVEFIPVDPDDPEKGFKVKPGTGNLMPPVITSLTIDYEARRAPSRLLTQNGFLYSERSSENATGFHPFLPVENLEPSEYADAEPSFYLGFDAAFPEKPVSLYIAAAPRVFSGRVTKEILSIPASSSALPSLQWEYFDGVTWRELTVIDETNSLTESGTVKFLTPSDMNKLAKFDLTECYWIRARSSKNDPFDTQQLLGTFLNTIPATQAVTVWNEILGSSNGQPDQEFRLTQTPVLPGQHIIVREPNQPSEEESRAIEREEGKDAIQEKENSETGETEIWVQWHEVPNFLQSRRSSRHFTLDHDKGLLTFGDGKRGAIPPGGTSNIAAIRYRTGGGTAGNVAKEDIAQISSSLPGVGTVANPVEADGGAALETVSQAKFRGPQTLRHRDWAVASGDLEWLAHQAAGTLIARAKCLPNINRDLRFEPGWVTLIIVPQGAESKLSPNTELIRQVENYLIDRAFVGLHQATPERINIIGPGYIQTTVVASVVPQDIDESEQVKLSAISALNSFLHPLTGGPDGTGWEFGRDVYVSEVYKIIEDLPGVNYVKSLQLIPNTAQNRFDLTSTLTAAVELPEGSVVRTNDRKKAALLAEPVHVGSTVTCIPLKGFKEGDRITNVKDLTVNSVAADLSTVSVEPFNSDAAGFPRYSPVTTLDGRIRTRLATGILPGHTGIQEIAVEDDDFASQLKPGDVLALLHPFPMTITSVTMETASNGDIQSSFQRLDIEPYETTITFPANSIMATLDNSVRLPLLTAVQAGQKITSINVSDFADVDRITIPKHSSTQIMEIQEVEPVDEIVYLDDNFLVYSGAHRITIVAG